MDSERKILIGIVLLVIVQPIVITSTMDTDGIFAYVSVFTIFSALITGFAAVTHADYNLLNKRTNYDPLGTGLVYSFGLIPFLMKLLHPNEFGELDDGLLFVAIVHFAAFYMIAEWRYFNYLRFVKPKETES